MGWLRRQRRPSRDIRTCALSRSWPSSSLGAAALLGVALFALTRYLESEAFRRAAVAAAQDTLGASVTVGEMHISLFSGATFRQVVVGNPPGLTGELLRADALVVRPRLLPLLRRRLEIAELRLDAPAITLIRNDHGEWSFERLVSRPVPTPPLPAGGSASGTDAPPPMPVSPALDVVVPRLALRSGTLAVTREHKGPLVGASGIEVTTSLSRVGGALAGEGQLAVESLRIAERVEIRELTAPLRFSGGDLTLAPSPGAAGGWRARRPGHRPARRRNPLCHLPRSPRRAHGNAPGGARRTQPERTARGPGKPRRHRRGAHRAGPRAEIRDGRLHNLPVLAAVAAALDLPHLRDLRFQEGIIDFTLAGDVLRTPLVRFVSGDVKILGKGEIQLRTGELAHEFTLLVPPAAVRRAPKEMRSAFTERADGLAGVDFRVWGPYRSPRTDLQDRVLRGFAESILRKGLRQFLR